MAKNKNRNKKVTIKTITTMEQFNLQKPRYNPYATGHGAWGNKGYNRNKSKQNARQRIMEY